MADRLEQFIGLGQQWLFFVGLAAWRALPLFVLAFSVTFVLRRKLSPAVHALLWTLVLIRLLMPISVGSPTSMHGRIDRWFSEVLGQSDESIGNEPITNPNVRDFLASHLPNIVEDADAQWDVQLQDVQHATPRAVSTEELVGTAFYATILLVAFALFARGLVSHLRFAWRLRRCPLLNEQGLIDVLLRECDALGVGRRPIVREVPELTAPAVFGWWRPTICMPTGMVTTLTEQELRWVLRHELAHIVRRDVPVMVMASLASAGHWFNPCVWLSVRRLRLAVETAADRLAIAGLSGSEAVAYGHLLVRLAEGAPSSRNAPALGLLPFASGKHLKHRVDLIVTQPGKSVWWKSLLAISGILLVALLGLTDARATVDLKKPDLYIPTGDSITVRSQRTDLEPWNFEAPDDAAYSASYDIASILANMPRELVESGLTKKQQLMRFLPLPTQVFERLEVEGETLTAKLSAHQHQLLSQTLEAWQRGEPKQISIVTRFMQTNIQTASAIDWAGKRIESLAVVGSGPAIAARIEESSMKHLVQAVQADRRSMIMYAPRVTAFASQIVTIADQVQRPFVTGVNPKSDMLQPVISTIDEGLKMMLVPSVDSDNHVTLEFEVTATNISKVSYANLPIRLPEQAEPRFTVQVPATERYSVSSKVRLVPGETVVVAIPQVYNLEPGADSSRTLLVSLTPEVVDNP